jgi:hypothetical protein
MGGPFLSGSAPTATPTRAAEAVYRVVLSRIFRDAGGWWKSREAARVVRRPRAACPVVGNIARRAPS